MLRDGAHKTFFSVDSDWLVSEEIDILFNKAREAGAADGIKCLFYPSSDSEAEMVRFIKLRQKILQKEDATAIILVCTGDTSLLSDNGHWFPFVVNVSEGRHEYVLADSICQNRLDDPRVKCLVEYLEGKTETLEIGERKLPVFAIIAVVGGAICFMIFRKRQKDAPQSTQDSSIRPEMNDQEFGSMQVSLEDNEADKQAGDDVADKKRIGQAQDMLPEARLVAA